MLSRNLCMRALQEISLSPSTHILSESLRSLHSAFCYSSSNTQSRIETPEETPMMQVLTFNKRPLPNTLPAELWLTIFESLPEETLRSVVLVCRSFRWLAQPLLFHTLSSRVSTVLFDSYARPTVTQLTPPLIERTLSQLEFYLSDRIYSSVRTIVIKPITIVEPYLSRHSRGVKDSGEIQRRVFRALGEFPNLTTLRLHDLTLTDADLSAIANLDVLDHITLDACDTSSSTSPAVPVRSLTIDCQRPSTEDRLKLLWKCFLQPSTLEELSIGPWSVVDNDVILSVLISAGPWPRLRTFKIGYGATEVDNFLVFLAQVPDLEELSFYAEDVVPLSPLPSHLVPNLRSYVGPVDTARDMLRHRKELRHLRVYGSGNVNIIDSHILLDRLKGLEASGGQLWSLHFEAYQLTKATFKLICEQFTQLRALHIYTERVGDSDKPAHSLADWLMEIPLASSIEYVSITAMQEETGADSISKEYMLLPTLSRRYQRLRYFHCTINSHAVRWDCTRDMFMKEDMSKEEWMAECGKVGE